MKKEGKSSRIKGFYDLSLEKRRQVLTENEFLTSNDLKILDLEGGLPLETAENMIENVIGRFSLPLGIALNFTVNGKDVLVPMVIEEPSVIAGASFMAKLARDGGGFTAHASDPVMIGQLQILDIKDLSAAEKTILDHKDDLLTNLKDVDPILINLGGGPLDLEVRKITNSAVGPFLIVHLLFDVRDAMGA
ncbi:MAG: 3-hydroxy-3-methylglutaryl-CoA reductase, partial [Anaerolineales bacterium]|nr:3-hydroxy-3-methylglutaryl-CoA reductase [Anaerolineales bacterium]